MREEVEVLEYHSHILSELIDVSRGGSDVRSFKSYRSRSRTLQKIKRSEESRLTGTGRADYNDDFAFFDIGGNAV